MQTQKEKFTTEGQVKSWGVEYGVKKGGPTPPPSIKQYISENFVLVVNYDVTSTHSFL